ncbi:MAG TPA: CpsD/CapB family tyrosine-protein kinase [Chloroflexota bacterium]|nr:CpsD/CapB family tyrosine-protein kinase [Chloroflexota bacterium]
MNRFTRRREPRGVDELAMLAHPESAAAEAYRTLRANIQLGHAETGPQRVLFTSAGPEEGKSTTLANVGVAAAQAGSRVLLVDADLRRPRLHELFSLSNDVGVTTAVQSPTTAPSCVQQTRVAGLRVLTSGPTAPSPVELLSSASFEELLTTVAGGADLIMLDSPPAGTLADASVLARCVSGVILVLDARQTRRESAQLAKAQLERVQARILGVVLSNASVDSSAYRY